MQLIKDHWHDDYMHLIDTQLDTRDNFEEFLEGLWNEEWSYECFKGKFRSCRFYKKFSLIIVITPNELD